MKKYKITKKYVRAIREMLLDHKLTTGHKTQKCAEVRKTFEENKKSKIINTEIYSNVIMYANLNKIMFNGWDGKQN